MGEVNRRHRHNEIKRALKRREKVKKLQARYHAADARNKEAIVEKLKKIWAVPAVVAATAPVAKPKEKA